MRPSWPRAEQRQRKEAPLETAICMLIWPQASLPSGTMRDSCVETRLHRDVRITLPLRRQRRGISLPRRATFLELDTVDGGESEAALGTCDEPWEDQCWEEREETEIPDDDWNRGASTRGHGVGRSIWLPGSSGSLRSDGVQDCFVGHEKRHTNIHGGQGSGLSGKACERLLPCGRCGCFRWFSNDNAERIATDWRRERYGHWREQPGRKRTWSWTRKREAPSRFPTPIASRIQSDINRSCERRTGARNSSALATRSALALSPNGTSGPGLSKSWDTVITLESISSVRLVALWG